MGLAIVVLAAGLGTRYGGLKQLEPLGPAGEIVLDYTLYDAATAGFDHAVVVVAESMVEAMTAHLTEFVPSIAVTLVVQATTRATPLGTAHATIVGADGLTEPFAVANADDSYGAEALATLATYLRALADAPRSAAGAVVGFSVRATLSPNGGVSRAVCRIDEHGHLLAVAEHTGVRVEGDGLVSDTATLDESTLVSMNLWGFDPMVVDRLRPVVERFIAQHHDDDRELRLPDLIGTLIERREIAVAVLPTTSIWLGVTYPEDAPHAREQLAVLTTTGVYPSRATRHESTR